MPQAKPVWTDQQVETIVGNLLRTGLLSAGAVILLGGILYLTRYGLMPAEHRVFHGEPADLRSPIGIIRDAVELRSQGVIQLGILLLMATPVARVVFSVFAFARQRDAAYVAITVVVLCLLLYSLFSGFAD